MIEIAVKNLSTSVSDTDMKLMLVALQEQISIDFKSVYGIDATLHWFEKGAKVPTGFWQFTAFENADQAGILGFHDKTLQGLPFGKAFLGTTLKYGGSPSVTNSHELLEMLLDPWVNLGVLDPDGKRLWNYEACDACEADELGYKRHGIQLSDFVKPNYFEPEVAHASKGRSFTGSITEALSVAPGGYMGFWNFETQGWDQVDAKRGAHHGGEGSRSALRKLKAHERRHSTAE